MLPADQANNYDQLKAALPSDTVGSGRLRVPETRWSCASETNNNELRSR